MSCHGRALLIYGASPVIHLEVLAGRECSQIVKSLKSQQEKYSEQTNQTAENNTFSRGMYTSNLSTSYLRFLDGNGHWFLNENVLLCIQKCDAKIMMCGMTGANNDPIVLHPSFHK